MGSNLRAEEETSNVKFEEETIYECFVKPGLGFLSSA